MASLIGYYALIFGLGSSFLIFYFSILNYRNSSALDYKVIYFTFLQLFFVLLSFLGLVISFVSSDFSNQTVFNHSHTTKPSLGMGKIKLNGLELLNKKIKKPIMIIC